MKFLGLNGTMAAFWIGDNDLSSPLNELRWEWVDNNMQGVSMIKCNENTEQPCRGKCLAGTFNNGINQLILQHVTCKT